jgi:O-antigen/teichoic acid export membrane protein
MSDALNNGAAHGSNTSFRPALQLMCGRATAFAVTFLIPVLLSRIFDKVEFGTYKQVFLVVYSVYGIGQMGMAECLLYFLPSFPEAAGRYVTNSMVMLFMTGLACFAALTVEANRVAAWLSNPSLEQYMWIAGACLLLMLTSCALETVMIARKRYRWATVSYATSDILRGALLVGFALATRSLRLVLMGALVFYAIRVAGLLVYARSEFRGDLHVDWGRLKHQLSYTLPFALAVLIEVIQTNYHMYAVSWYFDAATFAVYAVGCLQIPLTDFLASPASNVMMVRIGEELREGRTHRVLPIWHDTCRKLSLAFFPTVALLIVTAHRSITLLFTDRYSASIPIFMTWSLTILFAILQTDGMLRVLAETRFLVVMNLARLAAIAGVMSSALLAFGLQGPVIATLCGGIVAKSAALWRIGRRLDLPVSRLMPWWNLGGIALMAMLAAVPAAFLSARLTLPSIYVLPIAGVVYLAGYTALLWIFGVLNESEKRAMATIIGRYAVLVRKPE